MKREFPPDSVQAHAQRLRLIRLAYMKGVDNQAQWCRLMKIDPQTWNNAETGDNYLGRSSATKIRTKLLIGFDYIYFGDLRALPGDLAYKIAEIEAKEASATKA